jgi:hypothetical protein
MYIKSSYDKNPIISLTNEHEGFKWYFSKKPSLDKSLVSKLKKRIDNNFAKIEIPSLPGNSVNAYNPIYVNEKYVMLAINEYLNVSEKNDFRFHGDFSVGNVIYNKKECYIIDWENSVIDQQFWGVDILNIFFESIFFSFDKDILSKRNIQSATNIYKRIIKIFKEKEAKLLTIYELIELYNSNSLIWGDTFSKLPVLKFNKEQLEIIDSFQKNN